MGPRGSGKSAPGTCWRWFTGLPGPGSAAARRSKSARTELRKYALDDLLDVQPRLLPSYLSRRGRELKQWDADRRDDLMQALERLAVRVAPHAPRPFMNWSEVEEMSRHRIEFGNHTISHPVLPDLTAHEAFRELNGAAAQIRDRLGLAPVNFAYPYGKFDEQVRRQVQQEGVNSAVTTRLGLVDRDSDPYALNRINMCSDVCGLKPLFAARILGF
jgi:hypothetical protein